MPTNAFVSSRYSFSDPFRLASSVFLLSSCRFKLANSIGWQFTFPWTETGSVWEHFSINSLGLFLFNSFSSWQPTFLWFFRKVNYLRFSLLAADKSHLFRLNCSKLIGCVILLWTEEAKLFTFYIPLWWSGWVKLPIGCVFILKRLPWGDLCWAEPWSEYFLVVFVLFFRVCSLTTFSLI